MKKVLKAAALGASVVALATAASAADLNMNIYGASAQGKFWNTYAETFLEAAVADGGMGCTDSVKGYADPKSAGGSEKLGITVGFDCAGNGGDDVYIRYTSNKSVEGPRAVMNKDPQENDTCITGNPANDGLRKQAHYDKVAGTFTTACLDVHVGASDVASEAFTQESHGNKNGTYDSTSFDEVLDPVTIPGLDQIGTAERPIVVPFAFFANNALDNIDNLTRQQLLLVMSGGINKWSQFGPGYPNKKVVLCMRHAGSGTHATLDKAILRGDKSLPKNQAANVPPTLPRAGIMFHESSGDMMKCVNQNGNSTNYTTSNAAAIGYADADAIAKTYNADGSENNTDYPNVKRLKYNGKGEGMTPTNLATYGYSALKNEIINGSYEFWSAQWMYIKADQENAATVNLYDKMMAYASSTELPCPGLGCYWMTANEVNVTKEDDSSVPHF